MDKTNPLVKFLRATLGSKWGSRITYYGVFPALVILSLLLPPFSLGERTLYAGYTAISQEGGLVMDAYGAQLIIPPGAATRTLRLRLMPIPGSSFLSGQVEGDVAQAAPAIPPFLNLASPFYRLDIKGKPPSEAILALPMLHEAEPLTTLDLYAWTGGGWQWLPSHVQGHRVVAYLTSIPRGVALMQTAPTAPTVSVTLPTTSLPQGEAGLTTLNPRGLYVRDDGSLDGELVTAGPWDLGYDAFVLPVLENRVEEVIRSDWVDNILISEELRRQNVAAIVDFVVSRGYDGIDLDYRGIDPALRPEFTAFVTDLAGQLHGQGKRLTVNVEPPTRVAPDRWDTGAYDWRALGQVADRLKIPAPTDPRAYEPGGDMEALLQYAVGEVNRYKIELAFSTACRDYAGDQVILRSYDEALALACRIAHQGGPQPLLVGQTMTLDLPSLRESGGIQWDEEVQAYWFTYRDDAGQEHIVWLEDAASLAPKLEWATRFHLRGVALRSPTGHGDDPRLWEVLTAFREAGIARAEQAQFAVIWTVEDATGQTLVQETKPPADARFVWTAPREPGDYTVAVAISPDGGRTLSGSASVSFQVTAPTPTPTTLPTATPMPTPMPTSTPTPPPKPQFDGVVTVARLNVRGGPGTEYEVLGQCRQGDGLEITGKVSDGSWLKVITPKEQDGWVFAELVDLNVPLDTIALVTDIPPAPTPARQRVAKASTASSSAAAAAQALPPGGLDYGIQVDALTDGDHARLFGAVRELGFRWIKQQVEWFRFEPSKGQYNWGPLDRIVESANAHGLHILFSVVKAPKWARPAHTDFSVHGPPANPQDFADFLGAMAARYKGRVRAYEVWNEQNLWYEWGHEPLDAARYVQLLAASYRAIKAADPGAIVVAGALTPTGVNDGVIAIDDVVYLEQMYQAGLKNYCDAIGAHPSGYNMPPDALPGYNDPTAGFRGPFDNPHHSWSFRATMESYRNVMVRYGDGRKQIWPTEFGWASVEGLGVAPARGYEYAADNTEQEQAQFLVKAFQMARNWGWVGPMFVWNLNFGPVCGAADEKAAFGIVRPDWSRRPAFAALRDMPK